VDSAVRARSDDPAFLGRVAEHVSRRAVVEYKGSFSASDAASDAGAARAGEAFENEVAEDEAAAAAAAAAAVQRFVDATGGMVTVDWPRPEAKEPAPPRAEPGAPVPAERPRENADAAAADQLRGGDQLKGGTPAPPPTAAPVEPPSEDPPRGGPASAQPVAGETTQGGAAQGGAAPGGAAQGGAAQGGAA